MERKLRVLIITSMPWRNDNNIGNSYSNIFKGMEDRIEFAHIYCRSGMPQNKLCHRYFQVTEQDLLKNIKNRKYKPGRKFYLEDAYQTEKEVFSETYNKMRVLRWEIFFIARNMLWNIADWITPELDQFVEEFNPDVIFGTLTYMPNVNKLMVHLQEKFQKPLITYAWDDVYSLKQFSLSPFYWIRRFNQRIHIKKCVEKCEYLYTITDMMQREYSKYFNKDCKLLFKGYEFVGEPQIKTKMSNPVKMVFMGNIGAGRWKSLAKIVNDLTEINKESQRAELLIYTLSPKTDAMIKVLEVPGTSKIMDVVSNEEVMPTLRSADILVHVEPKKMKERLFYRLSFSTKLVDYFYTARCILGIGGLTASIDYLQQHDSGIVELDMSRLKDTLRNLLKSENKIKE
ncbi:hypothetical protein J9303_20845, partial [Bacillaceae bacterium Marseille-Q3522]|nr:hypothetical protein [Bacillaceae bacterium Marseille-Q3522]